ncbi:MAG: hypothetical protein PVF43_15355 [Candidatus Eiseniibacteriota bacterium]
MRSRSALVILAFLGLGAIQAVGPGCSSRSDTAVAGADSTLVYPARDGSGPEVSITFCRKISSRTGRPIGESQEFTMRPRARVRALIELTGMASPDSPRPLMFHLVWVGPDDHEIYTKRVDLAPDDGDPRFTSSISIPPGRRDPGPYMLRVYLFRELVAEKRFELLPPPVGSG